MPSGIFSSLGQNKNITRYCTYLSHNSVVNGQKNLANLPSNFVNSTRIQLWLY